MQAGRSFKELQEAYKNGERAFPVDAAQNSLHVPSRSSNQTLAEDAQFPVHFEWTPSLPQFNHTSYASAAFDQVRTRRCTRYLTRGVRILISWLGWSSTTLPASVLGIVCTAENRLNLLYSLTLQLTNGSTPMPTKTFLLFFSSVSDATTLTIPPHGTPHLIYIVECTDVFPSSK